MSDIRQALIKLGNQMRNGNINHDDYVVRTQKLLTIEHNKNKLIKSINDGELVKEEDLKDE